MSHNKNPFPRSKEGGPFRLWTGYGGEWITRRRTITLPNGGEYVRVTQVYLPIRPLQCVGRVPSFEFANRVIHNRTGGRVKVRKINSTGLTRDKQTDSWWLVNRFLTVACRPQVEVKLREEV